MAATNDFGTQLIGFHDPENRGWGGIYFKVTMWTRTPTSHGSLSNLADIDHLLPEELSGAHAVLAPVRAQHLVHHLVRLHHAHRAQHLAQS